MGCGGEPRGQGGRGDRRLDALGVELGRRGFEVVPRYGEPALLRVFDAALPMLGEASGWRTGRTGGRGSGRRRAV
ncbi:hypothetical protein [Actinomadura rubrisoli]|uniref:hypothetical protein n=1 Tax=Actinomadura rubrisoli TaxID=2530368 RepID=UPI001405334C|nr:hypothetical protein [Actinomadura rubrisoli]